MLTDFVAEFTNKGHRDAPPVKPWQVFIDSSSYQARGGVGLHIVLNVGKEYDYAIK